MKFIISIFVILVIQVSCTSESNGNGLNECPCSNPKWCQPVSKEYDKEVFIFSVTDRYWEKYEWEKTTTVVVMFDIQDAQLSCVAHSHGARIVTVARYPAKNFTNPADRTRWVNTKVDKVKKFYLDGVNVDTEDEVMANDTAGRDGFNQLVTELRSSLEQVQKHVQVTVDVAWSATGIDNRFYDYKTLAEISDFLFVMSYDQRSQFQEPCIAGPNSGFINATRGLLTYLNQGISPRKLVLGIPWYGYIYKCLNLTKNVCEIPKISFRGSECSDAAGAEIDYSTIMAEYVPKAIGGIQWDNASHTPFFNFQDTTGVMHQIWFDNPSSLRIKINLVKPLRLLGSGMWNADTVNYTSESPTVQEQTKEMWNSLIPLS